MKAVLLVGGEGTRLRPLTCNTVKAMVPILNRPFFGHLVDYLIGHGVDDIVVTLCYLPDRIEDVFGNGTDLGAKLTYVMEENPLGTAGAVKNAEPYLLDGPFFVFNGDIFTSIDLRAMLSFHRQRKARVTIALTPVENPSAYGVVETNTDGRVKRFIEKPPAHEAPTNFINAGIYILEPEILLQIPRGTPFMFEKDLFPNLIASGVPLYGYTTHDYWIDIGTPDKYRQVQYDLLQGRCGNSLCRRVLNNQRGAKASGDIHPSAVVQGSVVIGTDCSIGAGVIIIGPTVIGNRCTILESSTVDRVIIWDNVRIGKGTIVRESVVGNNCSIGDGCLIETGSIIGDNVVISDNTRLPENQRVWPDMRV